MIHIPLHRILSEWRFFFKDYPAWIHWRSSPIQQMRSFATSTSLEIAVRNGSRCWKWRGELWHWKNMVVLSQMDEQPKTHQKSPPKINSWNLKMRLWFRWFFLFLSGCILGIQPFIFRDETHVNKGQRKLCWISDAKETFLACMCL